MPLPRLSSFVRAEARVMIRTSRPDNQHLRQSQDDVGHHHPFFSPRDGPLLISDREQDQDDVTYRPRRPVAKVVLKEDRD